MPCHLFPAVLLTLCIGQLPAQQPFAERARTWPPSSLPQHLAADDPIEVAWAGHLVQRDGLREAVPDVRRALARLAHRDDRQDRLARLQLIDALIRLDVRIPAEELLPHATGSLRAAALVLAVKGGEANEHYFAERFAARGADLEWRVCGNWLAWSRDPDFLADCLEHVEFEIRLEVIDGKKPGVGVG